MKIITISREFGSGGREVGKRLADELGFAYYDREIITEIAKESNLDKDYVEKVLDRGMPKGFSVTFGRTFSIPDPRIEDFTRLRIAQQNFIRNLAKKGEDFVIVGRAADIILADYDPLNIFVYAGMDSKIDRCIDRIGEDEEYTEREMARMIKKVDSSRAVYHRLLSDKEWGDKESYDLMINTTYVDIKSLVPSIAAFAENWFKNKEKSKK